MVIGIKKLVLVVTTKKSSALELWHCEAATFLPDLSSRNFSTTFGLSEKFERFESIVDLDSVLDLDKMQKYFFTLIDAGIMLTRCRLVSDGKCKQL